MSLRSVSFLRYVSPSSVITVSLGCCVIGANVPSKSNRIANFRLSCLKLGWEASSPLGFSYSLTHSLNNHLLRCVAKSAALVSLTFWVCGAIVVVSVVFLASADLAAAAVGLEPASATGIATTLTIMLNRRIVTGPIAAADSPLLVSVGGVCGRK